MGRRKKMTEAELENTQTALTIEDSNQAEAEEAELLASTDSEVVAETETAEATEDVIAEEAPKPRARRRRAKKEEETLEVEAAEEVSEVEEKVEIPEEPVKKPRKPRVKKMEIPVEEIKEESIEVKPVVNPSLDQWAAIKELSDSVQNILENNKKLQMPAASLEHDTSEFFRPQQQPKTLFITKFATAASIVAVILSLVSLSLSQSARHAVLSSVEASKQAAIASTTGTASEVNPFRKSSRRIK